MVLPNQSQGCALAELWWGGGGGQMHYSPEQLKATGHTAGPVLLWLHLPRPIESFIHSAGQRDLAKAI